MNREPFENSEFNQELQAPPKSKNLVTKLLLLIGFLLLCTIGTLLLWIQNLNQAPRDFPVGQIFTIEEGMSVKEITDLLEDVGVVKSKDLLYYSLILFHEPTSLKASGYRFDQPVTTSEVATILTEGDFDTDLISFTHIEGERVTDIANRASLKLKEFNQERFLINALPQEGKLFPETYYIPPSFDDEDLLELMVDTFEVKIAQYDSEIEEHSLNFEEVIILASIIEREANTISSMKAVSSVLQNRLEIDMALQADASIEYILEKPLSELTPEDLEIDSPYNTYLYRGLPPTPIGNPGLDSIEAVLRPNISNYFYYITDDDGTFHFAETYQQHLKNIETYLR
jgi:UPF0755 protein